MKREALLLRTGHVVGSHESLLIALGHATPGDRIVMKSVTGSLTVWHVTPGNNLVKGIDHVSKKDRKYNE